MYFLFLGAALIFAMFVGLLADAFGIAGLFIAVGVVLSIVLAVKISHWSKKHAIECCSENMKYEGAEKTLYLYKQDPSNEKCIKIRPLSVTDYTYHPEQQVFTSVTVGGVTTGGFHTEGPYYSTQSSSTGRASLEFINGGDIKKIVLEERLISEVKKRKDIAQFLKGNALILEHSDAIPAEIQAKLLANPLETIAQNDMTTMATFTNARKTQSALTVSECAAIKAWISIKKN